LNREGEAGEDEIKRRLSAAFSSALCLRCVSPNELCQDRMIEVRVIEAVVADNLAASEGNWLVNIYDYVAEHVVAPLIGPDDVEPSLQRVEAWLLQFPAALQKRKESATSRRRADPKGFRAKARPGGYTARSPRFIAPWTPQSGLTAFTWTEEDEAERYGSVADVSLKRLGYLPVMYVSLSVGVCL